MERKPENVGLSKHVMLESQTTPACQAVILPVLIVIADLDVEFGRVLVQGIQRANDIAEEERRPLGAIGQATVGVSENEGICVHRLHHLAEPFGDQPIATEAALQVLRQLPSLGL